MRNPDFYMLFGFADITDRLIDSMGALLAVSVIGLIIGPVFGSANPWLWSVLDRLFGFGRKSYKIDRSAASLRFRGIVFGLLYIGTGFALGLGFHIGKAYLPGFAAIFFLSFLLSGGAVWIALSKLYRALKEGKILEKGSYRPIAVSSRADLNTTDDFGIVRVGIAFAAKAFDKGVVGPIFWYLLGGFPLACLYAGAACAAWALGKQGHAQNFGDIVFRIERLLGFLPNLLAGWILAAAALFTPGAQLTKAARIFIAGQGKARYAEGGLPVSVMAFAIHISLGGPVADLEGSMIKQGWIGPAGASARVDKSHLKRAIYISVMASVLTASLLIAGLLAVKQTAIGDL